jgi:hypothetical protein
MALAITYANAVVGLTIGKISVINRSHPIVLLWDACKGQKWVLMSRKIVPLIVVGILFHSAEHITERLESH